MKFKNSLVLGKMYPFTKGHQYLIDYAIERSEKTHVIITYNSSQNITGETRYNAIKDLYANNKNVEVYCVNDEGLPQYDHECETLDEFYSHWVPLVYSNVKELDVVFTSEDYGDDFAKYLRIKHILVDKDRTAVPISGTLIRSNPFKYWKYIADTMKPFFVKRIAIMGPESAGKSTISEILANRLNTNLVHEYGRAFYEINNGVAIDDFIKISEGRQEVEDFLIKSSNKYLICDTEDITTYIFSKMCYPNKYEKVEKYFLDSLRTKPKYDFYFLMKPDFKGVQDGTRNFISERFKHYDLIKSYLIHYGCNFYEIGGSLKDRENNIISILNGNK